MNRIRAGSSCLLVVALGSLTASASGIEPTPRVQGCAAPTLAAVAHSAKVKEGHGGPLVAHACKALPSRPGIVIAAVALRRSEDVVDVFLALYNTRTQAIEARGVETVEEDAALELHEYSLGLDTARYWLAPGVRAFGLYVDGSSQGSCPDGGFGAARTLFVQDGSRVRRVLGPIHTSTWQYLSLGSGMCHGAGPEQPTVIETYAATLAIGPGSSHGFRDLVVTVTASRDDGQPTGVAPLVQTLRYDGREYPTQPFESAYWKWRPLAK